MRPVSDCFGVMRAMRAEDRLVEALLTRQEVSDDAYAGLSSALSVLSLDRLDVDVDRRAAEFVTEAARLARLDRVHTEVASRRRFFVPRLATAALAAFVVLGSGVAAASDSAVPGDPLYVIDRALEKVAINDGGLAERLDEADELAARGQHLEGLNHAGDSLAAASPKAVEALDLVADYLASNEAAAEDVLIDVSGMLEWMATSDVSGRDFGEEVAERARDIGASLSESPGNSGQAGLPDDLPGSNENANTNDNQGEEPGPGNENSAGNKGGRGNGDGPPSGPPPGRGP